MTNIFNTKRINLLILTFLFFCTGHVFAQSNKIQFKNYTCFGRDYVWEVFLSDKTINQTIIAITVKDTFEVRGTTYLVHNILKTEDDQNTCVLNLQYKALGQSMELILDNCSKKFTYKATLNTVTSVESVTCHSP